MHYNVLRRSWPLLASALITSLVACSSLPGRDGASQRLSLGGCPLPPGVENGEVVGAIISFEAIPGTVFTDPAVQLPASELAAGLRGPGGRGAEEDFRYVVKRGDTLWGISARFLRQPWLWPELWFANPEIANPHLIYPGDTINLTWVDGKPRLSIARNRTIKLSPKVRTLPLAQAVQRIPIEDIRQFLAVPRFISPEDLLGAPYILALEGGHVLGGIGQRVFARHVREDGPAAYRVVRVGQKYVDPQTGRLLGVEGINIGDVEVHEYGDPGVLSIASSFREAQAGDYLLPFPGDEFRDDFLPTVPEHRVCGQVVAVFDRYELGVEHMVITLNRGSDHGLASGHVLAVDRPGKLYKDDLHGDGEAVKLPDSRVGIAMVFRTEGQVSHALLLDSRNEVRAGYPVSVPR